MKERGKVSKFQPLDFLLIFEKDHVWLLALNPSFTRNIYCNNCMTFSELSSLFKEKKIEFFLHQEIMYILGNKRFTFEPPSISVTTLISGSVAFFNEKYIKFGQKKGIFITDEHKIFRRRILKGPLSLSKIKYGSV